MDQIREQQECLARLHFDLDIHQDLQRGNDEESRKSANQKLSKLIDQVYYINIISSQSKALKTHWTGKFTLTS